MTNSIWIQGITRSGKTTRLVEEFRRWLREQPRFVLPSPPPQQNIAPTLLIFAANDDNRRELTDRLQQEAQPQFPLLSKTPLGFISDEVLLFWPLLFQKLNLKAQFPLRLRPETEQEFATQLWRPRLEAENLLQGEITEYRFVRQTLDLMQLAGAGGIPCQDIPKILQMGAVEQSWEYNPEVTQLRGELLQQWRQWCLERGLLSYGLIYELYGQYLLHDSTYQHHLKQRYAAVFADDLDDYPGLAKSLLEFLLQEGITGVFTYNPNGKIRLGLNADPDAMLRVADACEVVEELTPVRGLAAELANPVVELVQGAVTLPPIPSSVRLVPEISRAALLRKTADTIAKAVHQGKIAPEEIVIIAPGLDAIARYTLTEILAERGITVDPLNEQRPLISSPLVRALLTLLCFLYPHLGRFLLQRDAIAEMLVILSQPTPEENNSTGIDPVRAGLLADHCYYFDLDHPQLLPGKRYPRWDRLGYKVMAVYEEIRQWIEETKAKQQEQPVTPMILLNQAIERFLWNGSNLPYSQVSALRELMETAQHFWQVDRRLRQNEKTARSQTDTIAQFIQLLRRGTITANAYPVRPWGTTQPNAVTLTTIFQYRSLRRSHKWHFWLDAGSVLWEKSGAAKLFAYELFLQDWPGFPIMPEDQIKRDEEHLERLLRDLLGRVEERLYLCHSDLAVNGVEQTGRLLSLVHGALPIFDDSTPTENAPTPTS
ncbi:recombinase family protein [Spirulina sp. CS-785/01]|uniref:recombinase family protein n=1 Tax=Spirulina sp. CS-785/01 TaxID=3021716 RepID=UPI00232D34F8|nr:recombinase family protein [Spirulina sp. CS-785/01]MDB9314710.1 recombinase family protein [Spirulina sp. CS-785/01]